jgi:predicted glycoside hydrolase/deacetylase ChbG (UPF0249 family)
MRKQFSTTSKRFIRKVFSKSIQKRLGYPGNTKLLIIHADDLGISSSENAASFEAFEKGLVNSGSVMATCPKYHEVAGYSKTHPNSDIGVHLTLTSEWPSYKWGPSLDSEEVKSLTDQYGHFFDNKTDLGKNIIPAEVEKELRAQIDRMIESGIDLTHIDTHMFTAFSNNEILKICISLGEEYKLPVLLIDELLFHIRNLHKAIIVDRLYYAKPENNATGLINYYREVLRSIRPGLNCILVHIAFDNEEMQEIAKGQLNYGAAWRQTDFDFFTSNECRQLIKNNNIQLVTWREIRDKLIR